MVTPPIVDESCLIVAMATEWAGLSSGEPLDGSETVSVEDVRAGEDYLLPFSKLLVANWAGLGGVSSLS
jgi:hypothetical protein